MSPERDTVRTTVTLSHVDVVTWLRQQEERGVKLQEAVTEAILTMLKQEKEIAFLRELALRLAGSAPTSQPINQQTEQQQQSGWNTSELDEYAG